MAEIFVVPFLLRSLSSNTPARDAETTSCVSWRKGPSLLKQGNKFTQHKIWQRAETTMNLVSRWRWRWVTCWAIFQY